MKRADQDRAQVVSVEEEPSCELDLPVSQWAQRTLTLWNYRRVLLRVAAISLLVSVGLAFVIPKRYTAATSIMPPDSQSSGALLLATMVGRSLPAGMGGGFASSLFHDHSTTALFVSLLESGTVSDHLIKRFDLRNEYHKRYNVDAAKRLARATKISDDKKSGVITIKVQDASPVLARDLAQAYLDELNRLVTQTSTSAARQERIFIEARLQTVQNELENAQTELSDFSSRNSTVDLTAQTRALVDVGARIEGEIAAERSELESMRQVYSDENVHVRQAEARIGALQHELNKLAGPSTPDMSPPPSVSNSSQAMAEVSPPLRQLPRLGVRYADLYRRVKVQETVYQLLTQQYEMARIEEAKDIPVVRVIDAPAVPEKKSFPPRLLLAAGFTLLSIATACAFVLARERWATVASDDPRRLLADVVASTIFRRPRALTLVTKGVL